MESEVLIPWFVELPFQRVTPGAMPPKTTSWNQRWGIITYLLHDFHNRLGAAASLLSVPNVEFGQVWSMWLCVNSSWS